MIKRQSRNCFIFIFIGLLVSCGGGGGSSYSGPAPAPNSAPYFIGLPSEISVVENQTDLITCLLYTSPSPRDATLSRMPSSA